MRHNSPFADLLKQIDPRTAQNREVRTDAQTLFVTRFNPYRQTLQTRDFRITVEQWDAYQAGAPAQVALATLSDDDREFIMSGLDSSSWAEAFKGDD